MTKAIINFIPENYKKELFKNWRPISLLTSNYKILTKILSNRIKHTIKTTIPSEQTCGIPTRTIFCNLFILQEIIGHSSTKKSRKSI